MVTNETPNPRDLTDTKRRVELVKTLALLGSSIQRDTLLLLQRWTISGEYLRIYERLLQEWKCSEKSADSFSQAIKIAGIGAGLSSEKIRQDLRNDRDDQTRIPNV